MQEVPEPSSRPGPAPARRPWSDALIVVLLLAYATVVVRTAWLSDDAYITFRTVDNFVNGYGLTWNTSERVQAYTHPLWMFLTAAAYSVTREIFFTSLLLSIGVSCAAAGVLGLKLAARPAAAALGLLVLIFSKAFTDYSTSGLENPLSHLIIVLFFLVYLRSEPSGRAVFRLSLLASAAMLNRADLFPVLLPALACALIRCRRAKVILSAFAGFAPFIGWTLFSLFYYGIPVPNTAYAKLNTGIPAADLMAQGLRYLHESLAADPLTLTTIAFAAAALFALRQWRLWPILAGATLHLLYVVRVGGDFMSGRFLTPSLLCAVILLVRMPVVASLKSPWSFAFGGVVFVGLLAARPPVLSDANYSTDTSIDFARTDGIADERGFYYPWTGLLRADPRRPPPVESHPWALAGRWARECRVRTIEAVAIGFTGFYAGPQVHIIDPMALADPLLSRLHVPARQKWRIGHFMRIIPPGYKETLVSGKNEIQDRNLAAYYDHLSLATRGSLFDPERLKEIWRLNTGRYSALLKAYEAGRK